MRWVFWLFMVVLCGYLLFTSSTGHAIIAGFTAIIAGVLIWMAAAFAVGTIPFWTLFAIACLFAWYYVSDEEGYWAIVPFAVFCLFVQFVAQFDLLAWLKNNGRDIAAYLFAYLGLALLYVTWRWVKHLIDKAREVDELVEKFRLESPFSGPLWGQSDETKYDFTDYISRRSYNPDLVHYAYYNPFEHGIRPTFARNSNTLLRWFWWWPFSLLGWILNDLIREAYKAVARWLKDFADKLSNIVFGKRANYVIDQEKARAVLFARSGKEFKEKKNQNADRIVDANI